MPKKENGEHETVDYHKRNQTIKTAQLKYKLKLSTVKMKFDIISGFENIKSKDQLHNQF